MLDGVFKKAEMHIFKQFGDHFAANAGFSLDKDFEAEVVDFGLRFGVAYIY